MTTRCELIVKEAFVTEASWQEIENLFLINRNILQKELKDSFLQFSDGESRIHRFTMQMMLNEQSKLQNLNFER